MDAQVLSWLLNQTPVVIVLGIVIYTVWKEYKAEREYNRAQNKLMTDTLNQMSNLLSRISDSERAMSDGMDDIRSALNDAKTLVDIRTSEIITLLKSKE
jgi:hypothetical protein